MPQLSIRGKFIGSIDCVLFDKDGTLVNSEQSLLGLVSLRIEEAIRIYKKENLLPNSFKEFKKSLNTVYGITEGHVNPNGSIAIGSRDHNLISTASIFCLYGKDWSKSIQIANEIFEYADQRNSLKTSKQKQRLIEPGVLNLIQTLKKNKVTLGLISNDNKLGIETFLSENKLSDFFDYCWSSEDYPTKSNPKSIEKLCKILRVRTSQCALISDSDTDLLIAKKNGIQIRLGYIAGWSTKPQIYEHDHLINHWDELNIQ